MKVYKASVTICLTGDRLPYKVVEVQAKDPRDAALKAARAVNDAARPIVWDITVTHANGEHTLTSLWRYSPVRDDVWQ